VEAIEAKGNNACYWVHCSTRNSFKYKTICFEGINTKCWRPSQEMSVEQPRL